MPQITVHSLILPSASFLNYFFTFKIWYQNLLDPNSTKMQPHLLLLAVKHVCSSILTASVEGVSAALRSCAAWVDSPVTLLSWCTSIDTVDNGEMCVTKHSQHFLPQIILLDAALSNQPVSFPCLEIQRHTKHRRLINCDNSCIMIFIK